jgi:gustatory receptor
VLLGVRINVNDENERNEVIALVLKLMNRKLEITAGGLFTIDYSLLFSASLQKILSNL